MTDLQGGTTDAIEGAKVAVEKAKTRIDGIFGKVMHMTSDSACRRLV